jgi:hypothetical protein
MLGFDDPEIGPQYGGATLFGFSNPAESHDGDFSFCPANSQLYLAMASTTHGFREPGPWQSAGHRLIDNSAPKEWICHSLISRPQARKANVRCKKSLESFIC